VTQPLAGRTVAIVHPAWHSCGTYQVVLGQVEAYAAMGARVLTVAVSDKPGLAPSSRWLWRGYVAATPELDAQPRFFAGPPVHRLLSPWFFAQTIWPYLHGDQAAIRIGMAERAALDPALADEAIDLVHCNHFFSMPVARRIAQRPGGRRAPIVMDTHDLQARQFALINEALPILLPPRASFETMLAREMAEMADADALLHLNAEEDAGFRALLPAKAHHLVYPAVPDVPTGPGGPDILVVSSRNTANVESMLWFLREVMPAAGDPALVIAGSVDAGVRAKDAALHARYAHCFRGRVDDLAALYASARLVLLPTVAGTGLSIKTVEAMASGLPLIASPEAFRGMDFDPATLGNVTLAATAADFAAALAAARDAHVPSEAERRSSATREMFEARFSTRAYQRALLVVVGPLLSQALSRELLRDKPGASVDDFLADRARDAEIE
jgi:glycosyltransferase involved in cell wall biosynthesis